MKPGALLIVFDGWLPIHSSEKLVVRLSAAAIKALSRLVRNYVLPFSLGRKLAAYSRGENRFELSIGDLACLVNKIGYLVPNSTYNTSEARIREELLQIYHYIDDRIIDEMLAECGFAIQSLHRYLPSFLIDFIGQHIKFEHGSLVSELTAQSTRIIAKAVAPVVELDTFGAEALNY